MSNLKEFRLQFSKGEPVFTAGQTVKGTLYVNFKEPFEMVNMVLSFNGEADCIWRDEDRKRAGKRTKKEKIVELEKVIFGVDSNARMTELPVHPKGRYRYDFEFATPKLLPSSFESPEDQDLGYIAYNVKAIIHRHWSFDEEIKRKVVINEFPKENSLELYYKPMSSIESPVGICNYSCRPSGTISLTAALNKAYFLQGENILVSALAKNDSPRILDSLYARLIKQTRYRKNNQTKVYTDDITSYFGSSIDAYSYVRWTNIPVLVPLTGPSINGSKTIVVEYLVRVGVYQTFGKEIHVNLPIQIGYEVASTEKQLATEQDAIIGKDPMGELKAQPEPTSEEKKVAEENMRKAAERFKDLPMIGKRPAVQFLNAADRKKRREEERLRRLSESNSALSDSGVGRKYSDTTDQKMSRSSESLTDKSSRSVTRSQQDLRAIKYELEKKQLSNTARRLSKSFDVSSRSSGRESYSDDIATMESVTSTELAAENQEGSQSYGSVEQSQDISLSKLSKTQSENVMEDLSREQLTTLDSLAHGEARQTKKEFEEESTVNKMESKSNKRHDEKDSSEIRRELSSVSSKSKESLHSKEQETVQQRTAKRAGQKKEKAEESNKKEVASHGAKREDNKGKTGQISQRTGKATSLLDSKGQQRIKSPPSNTKSPGTPSRTTKPSPKFSSRGSDGARETESRLKSALSQGSAKSKEDRTSIGQTKRKDEKESTNKISKNREEKDGKSKVNKSKEVQREISKNEKEKVEEDFRTKSSREKSERTSSRPEIQSIEEPEKRNADKSEEKPLQLPKPPIQAWQAVGNKLGALERMITENKTASDQASNQGEQRNSESKDTRKMKEGLLEGGKGKGTSERGFGMIETPTRDSLENISDFEFERDEEMVRQEMAREEESRTGKRKEGMVTEGEMEDEESQQEESTMERASSLSMIQEEDSESLREEQTEVAGKKERRSESRSGSRDSLLDDMEGREAEGRLRRRSLTRSADSLSKASSGSLSRVGSVDSLTSKKSVGGNSASYDKYSRSEKTEKAMEAEDESVMESSESPQSRYRRRSIRRTSLVTTTETNTESLAVQQ